MNRHLIVGDIHGCYDELMTLCEHAALAEQDVLVSVGDVVDRGPEPTKVVNFLRTRPNTVVLMGNHERKHVRQVFSFGQEVTRLQMGDGYQDAVRWMTSLPYYLETPCVRIVHAAMVPGLALEAQREDVLAGTTAGEAFLAKEFGETPWHTRYQDPKPVAFGHAVVGTDPLVREGSVYGLDTGACHGMRLTALSVPDFRLYSVPARENYWERVARTWEAAVMRTRPLGNLSWSRLEESLRARASSKVPEVQELVQRAQSWAERVRALIPQLEARVPVLLGLLRESHGDALDTAINAHPAKPLLHACARGRLDHTQIASRCVSPDATLALARKLGMDTQLLETPPY